MYLDNLFLGCDGDAFHVLVECHTPLSDTQHKLSIAHNDKSFLVHFFFFYILRIKNATVRFWKNAKHKKVWLLLVYYYGNIFRPYLLHPIFLWPYKVPLIDPSLRGLKNILTH